ncbi:MAG TPA: DsrE family protein [Anaerolineaceae bacterium]|nr:DsrE family protein [Anaerolineaceae bacterium]
MENESHLYIVWTTDNPITAMNMVTTYGGNSMKNGWWDEVTIILWGASQQLVAANTTVSDRVRELMDMGVKFSACKRCADELEVTQTLESMGVEVIYWGEPMTKLLKSGAKMLTI